MQSVTVDQFGDWVREPYCSQSKTTGMVTFQSRIRSRVKFSSSIASATFIAWEKK